jgi:dihydroxy-acid dehydratase
VFHSYQEMRDRIDDPALDVAPDSVLVLAGCGPVGAAMPEWGMIPIPRKLLDQGVTDMLRISDARMSGTSFGTVVLHVAPESAVGGPLARLRDGDVISLDASAGELTAEVGPHGARGPRARAAAYHQPARLAAAAPPACHAGTGGMRLRLPSGAHAQRGPVRRAGHRPLLTKGWA